MAKDFVNSFVHSPFLVEVSQMNNKQLLDEVFVISRIIKVE